MKTTVVDGKELQKNNKFAEVKDKKIQFYKMVDFNVSKPGKHGSSKKIIKATNLLTGKVYETTYGGNVNVFFINDFEYITYPIYMVDQDMREFTYDLEEDRSISLQELDSSAEAMLSFLRIQNPGKSGDDLLTDADGNRLCLLINECSIDGVETKFLWDIVYVPEDNLEKKLQPGTFYDAYIKSLEKKV